MKFWKFITNPWVLIISFFILLISGEHFGGFYLIYILMALPHGGIHAILALTGVVFLLVSFYKYHRMYKYIIEPVLNVIGILCLIVSVLLFFYNDKQGYNSGTFEQTVPLITFIWFGVVCLLFFIANLIGIARSSGDNDLSLRKA